MESTGSSPPCPWSRWWRCHDSYEIAYDRQAVGTDDPTRLWSDGETLWVTDGAWAATTCLSSMSSGQVASSVTGLYPWLGYKLSDRVSVWGATGYGKGALTLTPGETAALRSGLAMGMAGGGLRGDLADSVVAGFGLAQQTAAWGETPGTGERVEWTEDATSSNEIELNRKGINIAGRHLKGNGNRHFPTGSGKARRRHLVDFNFMTSEFRGT